MTKNETKKPANQNKKPEAKPKATPTPMNPPAPAPEAAPLPYTAKEVTARGKAIRAELGKVNSAFEKIAFSLYWFYDKKAFEAVGYKNIYDMAAHEFGIARGTTSNFINVVERFAKRDEAGKVLEEISDSFRDFKSSQLIAMLGSSDEDLEKVNAKMSVRDIKKALKPEKDDKEEKGKSGKSDGKAGETDGGEDGEEVKEVSSTARHLQSLISFRSLEDYNRYLDGMNDYIERALSHLKEGQTVEIVLTW